MPDWPSPIQRDAEVIQLREQLGVAVNNSEILGEELRESFADVELALEDRGWWQITTRAQYEFTRTGLDRLLERIAAHESAPAPATTTAA